MTDSHMDDVVELLRETWYSHTMATRTCQCGYKPPTGDDWTVHRLRAILAALSSANRLVPPGSEVREEWGTRHLDIETCERVVRSAAGEQSARRRFEDLDEVWGHHAELIRRRVITTPWSPVKLPTGTDEPIPRAETSAEAANPSVPDTEEGS